MFFTVVNGEDPVDLFWGLDVASVGGRLVDDNTLSDFLLGVVCLGRRSRAVLDASHLDQHLLL